MPTPCPTCSTPIVTATSLACEPIVLQIPPVGWNFKSLDGMVLRDGHVEPTTKPKPGEEVYVTHRQLCKPI